MLKYAVVFYVIAIFLDGLVTISALQIRDIRNLIENLQHNEEKYNNKRDDQSQELDENKGYVVNSRELDALINEAGNDLHNHNINEKHKHFLEKLKTKEPKTQNERDKDSKLLPLQKTQRNPIKEILLNLANRNSDRLGSKYKEQFGDDRSKIYLILNPRPRLKQKDIKAINMLFSQILSGSSGKKIYSNRHPISKDRRYKGFFVSKGRLARRRNRESDELYSKKDSLEDFKPKRVRGNYGGGAGRTPIPYIRQRDIFERE